MEMKYITERQVSELTQLSLSKLRNDRWLNTGLPYCRIGKSIRYELSEVLNFMENHKILVEC